MTLTPNGATLRPNVIAHGCPRCGSDLAYAVDDLLYRCVGDCDYARATAAVPPTDLVVVAGTPIEGVRLVDLVKRWGISEAGVRLRLQTHGDWPNPSTRVPIPTEVVAKVEEALARAKERNAIALVPTKAVPAVPALPTAQPDALPTPIARRTVAVATGADDLRLARLRLVLEEIRAQCDERPDVAVHVVRALADVALRSDALADDS